MAASGLSDFALPCPSQPWLLSAPSSLSSSSSSATSVLVDIPPLRTQGLVRRPRVGVGVLRGAELMAGHRDLLGTRGCGVRTPFSPPAWLGACCKSFYPQAKASKSQSWGRRSCSKRREKEHHCPGQGGRASGEAGRGRPGFLAGESLVHLPQVPTLAEPAAFREAVLSHNSVSLCV